MGNAVRGLAGIQRERSVWRTRLNSMHCKWASISQVHHFFFSFLLFPTFLALIVEFASLSSHKCCSMCDI